MRQVRRVTMAGAVAAVLALGSLACEPGPAAPNLSVATFDSLAGWQVYRGAGHDGNGTRQRDRVAVGDGILTITGEADGSTGGLAWDGHTQRFGRWDVRLRAPAGCACYHPVVLLWGSGGGSGVDNPKGEIDIVESYANPERDRNTFSVHYGDGSATVGATAIVDMTRWHVYHLLWRDNYLATWIDDDRPYFETRDASVLPPGPADVAIQLDWFPQDGRTGGSTATMQVDYVQQSSDTGQNPP